MVIKDEQEFLPNCLESAKGLIDELIVVDTGSRDNTLVIAKKYGAKIIRHKWNDDFGLPRNISKEKAKGNWILILDADETIAQKDIPKIRRITKNYQITGFEFTQRTYSNRYGLLQDWQKSNGEYPEQENLSGCAGWAPCKLIRLFRNRKQIHFNSPLAPHSSVRDSILKIDGKIADSGIHIHHFQCLKSDKSWEMKQKYYLKLTKKRLKLFPDSFRDYYYAACGLFTFEDKDREAIGYLKKALSINPKFRDAYYLLGIIYKERHRYRASKEALEKAIEIAPSYADAYCVLGMVLEEQNLNKKAVVHFKKAIDINPQHPLAHNWLGFCYAKQKRPNNAITEYRKSLKINPQDFSAKRNLKILIKANV